MTKEIKKFTYQDLREQLSNQVSWVYDVDMVNNYVYTQEYEWEENKTENYQYSYSVVDFVATVDLNTKTQVVKNTTYSVVPDTEDSEDSQSIMASLITRTLDKYFKTSKPLTPVIKQFNDESMVAVEPLYTAVGEFDLHEETIDSFPEMQAMVKSMNTANEEGSLQSSISHIHKTKSFSLIKASVYDHEVCIGEIMIPANQPIAEIQFHKKSAWEMRKDGRLLGLSIGAQGVVEDIDKAKRLKGVNFNFKGGHLAYTDASVGGAASGKNTPYILKQGNAMLPTKEQDEIIKELDEEFTPLDKKQSKATTPLSPSKGVGDNTKQNEGNTMSDELIALQKRLDAIEAENKLLKQAEKERALESKVSHLKIEDSELLKSLTSVMSALGDEQVAVVVKALDVVASIKVEELNKAKEQESTPLAKALTKEIGEAGKPELEVTKFKDEVASEYEKILKKGKI